MDLLNLTTGHLSTTVHLIAKGMLLTGRQWHIQNLLTHLKEDLGQFLISLVVCFFFLCTRIWFVLCTVLYILQIWYGGILLDS